MGWGNHSAGQILTRHASCHTACREQFVCSSLTVILLHVVYDISPAFSGMLSLQGAAASVSPYA